jgi:hypothetical protein
VIAFERPATRADELAGKPGVVRFLDLPERRFVMIDGDGPAGEAAFSPRMPGVYGTAWPLRFALKKRGVETMVGPLEGLWWTLDGSTDLDAILGDERTGWRWTLMIALPDEASEDELTEALERGREKIEDPFATSLRSSSSRRAGWPSSSISDRTPPSGRRSSASMRRSRRRG